MISLKRTARDLINKSFVTAGITGVGELPTDQEAIEALDLLNEIISKFNNEDMFFIANKEYSLPADGKNIYLLENISTDGIKEVFFYDSTQYTKLVPLSLDQDKYVNPQNGSPDSYFFNYDFPLSQFKPHPTPSGGTFKIITNGRIELIDNLDVIIYMPDGWEICLRYNLALRLANEYKKPIDEFIVNEASTTKTLLKNTMQKQNTKKFYSDYPGCYGTSYDIMRG